MPLIPPNFTHDYIIANGGIGGTGSNGGYGRPGGKGVKVRSLFYDYQ